MTLLLQRAPTRQVRAAELLPRPLDQLRMLTQVFPVELDHLMPLMDPPATSPASSSPNAVRAAERTGLQTRRGPADIDRTLRNTPVIPVTLDLHPARHTTSPLPSPWSGRALDARRPLIPDKRLRCANEVIDQGSGSRSGLTHLRALIRTVHAIDRTQSRPPLVDQSLVIGQELHPEERLKSRRPQALFFPAELHQIRPVGMIVTREPEIHLGPPVVGESAAKRAIGLYALRSKPLTPRGKIGLPGRSPF